MEQAQKALLEWLKVLAPIILAVAGYYVTTVVAPLSDRLTALEKRLDSMSKDLYRHDEHITRDETRTPILNQRMDKIGVKIEKLETYVNRHEVQHATRSGPSSH